MPSLFQKKNIQVALIAAALCIIASGCTDNCKKTVCNNGGTCVNGTCNCADGYQGDSCNYETRSFYYGTYNVHAECSQSGTSDYTANISEVPGQILKVNIANFGNTFSNDVTATVNGNHLTIASQVPDNDGRVVSGSGTLSGNTIQMSYSIAGATSTDICDQTTWVK